MGVETIVADEGGEVEFVDGHAVEQDGSPKTTGDSARDEEKAAAREAVRKALGKSAEDAGEEAAKAVKTKKEAEKAQAAKADEPEDGYAEDKPKAKEPDIKAAIKAREKQARQRAEEAAERARFQAEREQFIRAAQAERQAIEAERQRLAALRTDPVKAIQEAGWDPEELILNLAKHGTPEGKAELMRRQELQRLAELENWQKQQLEERERYIQHVQEQQAIQYRQTIEQQFLSHVTEEKAPHLAALYEGREGALVAEGHAVAREYRRRTGQEASVEDIAEYLEEQAALRFSKLAEKRASKTGERRQVVDSYESPASGKVARGKTLSSSSSGERRALSKDLRDLEGDERLEAARLAVRAALKANKDD